MEVRVGVVMCLCQDPSTMSCILEAEAPHVQTSLALGGSICAVAGRLVREVWKVYFLEIGQGVHSLTLKHTLE